MTADLPSAAGIGTSTRLWVRRLQPMWSLAIIALVAVFVWRQRSELTQAIRVLRLASWPWLLLVVLSALVMHGLITQALSSVFARLGRRIPFVPALMTHAEREMLATVIPLGGAASFVTLVSRFGVYGVTPNDAGLAMVLYSAVGHLSFIAVAIPAMIVLISRHGASAPILVGATVVLAVAVLALLLVASLARGTKLPAPVERRLPRFVHELRKTAAAAQIAPTAMFMPLGYSFVGDLFGVISMWTALHAVRAQSTLEIALVAYTVGTMLQLAAPVFQGLGIVEVSIIVVLQRLGVPASQAIGATLLYRFVDVWLPVIFGVGVHARYQKALRGLPANLPALWTAFSGILALVSVLPARVHIPLVEFRGASGFSMLHSEHAGRTITLVAGFLLLILSFRLLRRQRAAWFVALVLSSGLTALYLTREYDKIGAIFSGANVVILLLYRARFKVRSDIPTLRRGVYVLVASFTATYTFGVLSLWLADQRHFGHEFSIAESFHTATQIFFGFGNAGLEARTARGEWIIDSMHLLGVLSILVSAFAILQPIIWRHRVQPHETERARELIARYGHSSLDRFKYWPDKFQFFSTDGAGVVSFGLSGRIALALGDPTARDQEAFAETLDEFLEFCAVNGWDPAFHQVPATYLEDYRARGLTPLMIGHEAIVRLQEFTLTGKSMHSLRSARNRAEREGRYVDLVEPPLSAGVITELSQISDEWLTLDGRRERTFTLGRFDPDYVRDTPVLVLRSGDGRGEAFVNLIPDGVPGELTFDLMRHRVDAPNGSMDLLMLALIDLGKSRGDTTLSLGMVPFLEPDPDESMGTTDRAIAQLARPMGRFFASVSLFAYKDKFHPVWEPRYLIMTSVTQLPRVALALTRLAEMERQNPLRKLVRRNSPLAAPVLTIPAEPPPPGTVLDVS